MYVKVSRRKISEGREGERKQRKGGEGKDMRERKMEEEEEEESQFSSQTSSSRKKKKKCLGSTDIKKLDRCKNKIQKRTKIINKGKHLRERKRKMKFRN